MVIVSPFYPNLFLATGATLQEINLQADKHIAQRAWEVTVRDI